MDQNFHLIEKYFQGKLSQDELQLFNEKLQKDSAFEQEFRDMKLIRDAVKETSRTRALDILQNAEANLTNQETTKINVSMKRLVSIAASLLIVATVSYFAFSGGTGALTGEEIVANYYEPYTNIVSGGVRGDDNPVNTLTARAYNAYDIGDYSTSADLFEDLLTTEKSAANYLYSGIANLESGNLEAAKNNLNAVMNNFSDLKDQAQWYLAMTLFKEGAKDAAVANIVQLSMNNSSYKKDANRLIRDLELVVKDSSDDSGVIIVNNNVPPEEGDSPDGSVEFLDLRQYQYGQIRSIESNEVFNYINDLPVLDLKVGDIVEYVIVSSKNSNKGKPMAIIMDNGR